jgi:uncharacterized protein DUF4440
MDIAQLLYPFVFRPNIKIVEPRLPKMIADSHFSQPRREAGTPDVLLLVSPVRGYTRSHQTIRALDAELFDAYNKCDLEKFGSLIDENVEFYHDKAGNTFGRAALVEAIKNNICGKVTRELVPGTLQVYPMKGYGALEIGVHRFHHPGQSNDSLGEASFIHLWQ